MCARRVAHALAVSLNPARGPQLTSHVASPTRATDDCVHTPSKATDLGPRVSRPALATCQRLRWGSVASGQAASLDSRPWPSSILLYSPARDPARPCGTALWPPRPSLNAHAERPSLSALPPRVDFQGRELYEAACPESTDPHRAPPRQIAANTIGLPCNVPAANAASKLHPSQAVVHKSAPHVAGGAPC
jgi:hypothetical protein